MTYIWPNQKSQLITLYPPAELQTFISYGSKVAIFSNNDLWPDLVTLTKEVNSPHCTHLPNFKSVSLTVQKLLFLVTVTFDMTLIKKVNSSPSIILPNYKPVSLTVQKLLFLVTVTFDLTPWPSPKRSTHYPLSICQITSLYLLWFKSCYF